MFVGETSKPLAGQPGACKKILTTMIDGHEIGCLQYIMLAPLRQHKPDGLHFL
jgi:hypothetical protein